MNCESLRETVYEYLDDSLPPPEAAAARTHLHDCTACREIVQREKELCRSMAAGFEQAVAGVQLEDHVRRRIVAAMDQGRAEPRSRGLLEGWRRLLVPVALAGAAGAVMLVATISPRRGPVPPRDSKQESLRVSPHPSTREVAVRVTWCVPSYTFRREGNTVIDALTCEPQIAEGALLVKD